jgi:hypothetical protein
MTGPLLATLGNLLTSPFIVSSDCLGLFLKYEKKDLGITRLIVLKKPEKIVASSSTDVSKKTIRPMITPAINTKVAPMGEIMSATFIKSEKPIRPVLAKAAIERTKIKNPSDTLGRAKKNLSLINIRPKKINAKGIKREV